MKMYNRISVYVVAHQDDWQLFMDPYISADIVDLSCKTVIIYTTAGDAGEAKKYWMAREWGAINSLLFRISDTEATGVTKKNIKLNNKSIQLFNIGNCSFYFLRLPDGGMKGEGFERYDFQSIASLRLHIIDEITTVDSNNTFFSFEEISRLINAIVEREQKENCILEPSSILLNFPEYDNSISPNDHSDHTNTAFLIECTEIYKSAKKRAFVHYHIQHVANDLSGMDLFWKVSMFSVYHQAVLTRHGHSTIRETPEYGIWCRKNAIFREII
jgi:GlcNAc-PI de-N-acetylase